MNARCRLDQPRPALKTRRGRSMLFLPPLGLIGRLTPKILTRTVNGLSMLDRRCLHTGQPSGWQTRDFPPIPLCQPGFVLDLAARYPRRKCRRGVPRSPGSGDVPRTGLGRPGDRSSPLGAWPAATKTSPGVGPETSPPLDASNPAAMLR